MKNLIRKIIMIRFILLCFSCNDPSVSRHTPQVEDVVKNQALTKDTPLIKKDLATGEQEILGAWLKESIDEERLIAHLGKAEKRGVDEYWAALGMYMQEWEYTSLGIKLEMESKSKNGNKRVYSILIQSPCTLKTSKGIGVGSDEKMLRTEYRGWIDEGSSTAESIVVGSLYGGTVFSMKNGVVSKIFIGPVAE